MVVTQSRVGQSTPRPSAPSRNNQSRPGQSTVGPGGRGTTPAISGGGRSSPREPQPEVPADVQPALDAASRGQTAAAPQSIAELIRRKEALRNISRQTGRAFTQTETRRALGGAVQGTNITYSRIRNTPEVNQYIKQLRSEQQTQVGDAVRSSTRTNNPQALKPQARQSNYGSGISDRIPNRNDLGTGGSQLPTNSRGNIIARLLRGIKEGRQEQTKETYVSALGPTGAFVTTPEDTGGRGTVIARVPTASEFSSISRSDSTGEVLDRSAKDVVELGETYSQLTKGFDKLSVEEQQSRVSRIRELGGDVNPITNEIIPPQVGIGFGVNKRLVGVDELDTRNPGQVYRSAFAVLAGKKAREAVEGQVEQFKPVTNMLFSTSQFSGRSALGRIARGSIAASPRVAETVASQGVNVGAYIVPGAGQTLFFTEQAGNIGYEIARSNSLRGGAVSYVQKFPYEVGGLAVVGGAALAKGLTPAVRIVRNTQTIPSRSPQIFVNPTSAKTIITPEGNKLYEISYAAAGRARRGAEISNVQVFQERPLFGFFGGRGRLLYDSAVGGRETTLRVAGPASTLSSKSAYRVAFESLRKQGYSESQARSALRSFTKSPTDIAISGRGNVIMGATDRDLVMASGELRYEAAQQPMSIFRNTRNFAPFKERTSTLGASLVEKDGVQYFLTESDVVRLFYPRGKPTQEFMKLSQAGRTTRQVQQLSGVKEIGQVELPLNTGNPFGSKALQFNVLEEGSLSRQTIPLRRAVAESKSTIFVRDVGDDVTKIDYGQPFKVDTIPMKPTRPASSDVTITDEQGQNILSTLKNIYGDRIAEGGKNVAARLPKPNLGFPKAPKSGTTIVSGASGKAEQVAGLGSTTNVAAASKFFGTGQYERTEMVSVSTPEISPVTAFSITPPSSNFDKLSFSPAVDSTTKQNSFSRSIDALKDSAASSFRNRSRSRMTQSPSISLKVEETTKTNLDNIAKTRQTPRLRQLFNQVFKLKSATIKAPKPIKLPVILPNRNDRKEFSTKLEDSSGTFKVFTKKFGKDILLGEEGSKGAATKLLRNQLTGTLRASGFIVNPSGQKLKATELNLGRGFRPGKRDPFRVVQRRGFRLGSGGEVAEIKSARRSRSRSSRLF